MRILFYGDVHFRSNGSFIPWNKSTENGLSFELNNTISGCSFVAELIRSLCPDLTINTGDVYHSMESIDVPTLYGSSLGLQEISKACKDIGIKHFLIAGNHDVYSEVNEVTSIAILSGYFDEIISTNKVLNNDVGVVPFHSKPEDTYNGIMEVSGMLLEDGIIVTHNDFAGAKYENNHPTDASLSPDLPLEIFSGHLHLPQSVGNVTFVGSLVQHRFSQYGLNENGVLTFDTESKEVKRFRNNRSKHYVISRSIEESLEFDPQKVVLKLFTNESQEEAEKLLSSYEYSYFKKQENKDDVETTVTDFQIEDPLSALKVHISKENPEALDIFEKVIKKIK